jgi:hypothetical protein
MTVELAVQKEQELLTKAESLMKEAERIIVVSQDTFEHAVEFGKNTSTLIKSIEAYWSPLKKAAKASHALLCDEEKKMLKIPLQADEIVKRTANTWKTAQRVKDAENQRIEQERLRVQAEADRKEELATLRALGAKDAVKVLKTTPVVAPQAEVAPVFQKVAGTRNRTEWHHEITDKSLVPDQFWIIDERAVREYVKAMREKAIPGGGFEIPGVKVWSTEETDW